MSDDKRFRKQSIVLESGKEIVMEAKPLDKIFRFNEPAYLVFGSSGAGKSTIAMDLLHTFAGQCSNIYYMTSTTESMQDSSISVIPKCFRREPNIENLINVWEEIKSFTSTINVNDAQLFQLIKTAYKNDANNMIIDIQQRKASILKEQIEFYKEHGKDVMTASKLAQNDATAFMYETVIAIVNDYIKNNGDDVFSNGEMTLIRSFHSKTTPRTLLILDDITGQLEAMSKSNAKTFYEGKLQREKDAISAIFTDMLTRCRHYNALVCIFLHTTVPCISDKSLLVNVVFMNEGAIDKVSGARTMPETTKNIMKVAKEYVFNSGYKYYFLYINSNEVEKTCVGKASLHDITEPLKLDALNRNYREAYEKIASGIDAVNIIASPSDNDEGEYYSEDAEGFA
jgi:ABC-type dipeptide/oligopeptide/nickel transport system ATPase subunit